MGKYHSTFHLEFDASKKAFVGIGDNPKFR